MALKTDYREPEFSGDIKYLLKQNGDGTVSFEDRTTYIRTGDYIVAANINETNAAINTLAARYSAWIPSYTALKTNFKDSQWTGEKKFQMSQSGDTVTLTDVTTYSQVGDSYQASDINAANTLLNNLTNNCDTGLELIRRALSVNGATNTDDLAKALDDMVTARTNAGYNKGKSDAQSNPTGHDLVPKATYDTLVTNMRTEKNITAEYKNQLNNTETGCASLAQDALNHANSVKKGDSADYGMAQAQYVNACIEDISRFESTSFNTYNSNCATEISRLRGLL